jgi:transcriptional regulator with XRE-family HTH domain
MTKREMAKDQKQKFLPRYKDKLMGLPVVLLNAAYECSHGEERGVIVPDVSELESAIALARVTIPEKLSGAEIKYLRKAIGEKANTIAVYLDLSPEHFSRLENGGALGTNAERIFRLRVARDLRPKARGVIAKDDTILNMTFVTFRHSLEPVTLIFDRLFMLDEDTPRLVWHFVGVDSVQEPARTLKVVA